MAELEDDSFFMLGWGGVLLAVAASLVAHFFAKWDWLSSVAVFVFGLGILGLVMAWTKAETGEHLRQRFNGVRSLNAAAGTAIALGVVGVAYGRAIVDYRVAILAVILMAALLLIVLATTRRSANHG